PRYRQPSAARVYLVGRSEKRKYSPQLGRHLGNRGLYTPEQRMVLKLLPGVTDPASLKYFNESKLLAEAEDPNCENLQWQSQHLGLRVGKNRLRPNVHTRHGHSR